MPCFSAFLQIVTTFLLEIQITISLYSFKLIEFCITVFLCLSVSQVSFFSLLQDYINRQTRFVSRKPAKVIISNVEAVAESMSLKVHTRNYKVWFVVLAFTLYNQVFAPCYIQSKHWLTILVEVWVYLVLWIGRKYALWMMLPEKSFSSSFFVWYSVFWFRV